MSGRKRASRHDFHAARVVQLEPPSTNSVTDAPASTRLQSASCLNTMSWPASFSYQPAIRNPGGLKRIVSLRGILARTRDPLRAEQMRGSDVGAYGGLRVDASAFVRRTRAPWRRDFCRCAKTPLKRL